MRAIDMSPPMLATIDESAPLTDAARMMREKGVGDILITKNVGRQATPIGLITDGTHALQRNKVAALGIEPEFHTIVYTGALGKRREFHKPHPRAFEIMEAALGDDGHRLVYVGDNPAKDFIAPNLRGWLSVQIVRPNGIHDHMNIADGGEPHHRIHSLTELVDLLVD